MLISESEETIKDSRTQYKEEGCVVRQGCGARNIYTLKTRQTKTKLRTWRNVLGTPDFFQTGVEQGEVGPEQKLAPIPTHTPQIYTDKKSEFT